MSWRQSSAWARPPPIAQQQSAAAACRSAETTCEDGGCCDTECAPNGHQPPNRSRHPKGCRPGAAQTPTAGRRNSGVFLIFLWTVLSRARASLTAMADKGRTGATKRTGRCCKCFHRHSDIITSLRRLGLSERFWGWGGVVMAKLSDLFGRKGGAAEVDKLLARAANGNGNGSNHISVENLSDVGSRMGEENEVLRNLLTDTGRKISELADLKEAFDKLVAPFNSTLRALEQEKSQTMSLSGMLAEARTAYETLREEFYQIEKKATVFEGEAGRLREDLELSREANRALESARLELIDDINARRAQIAELDRQLAQETTQRRTLSDSRRVFFEQNAAAEKRIVELEGELAAARESLALLEDEKRSLQIAVDQALNETARLTRRLTESENTLTAP